MPCCPNCGYDTSKITEWDFSEWRITTQYGSVILKSMLQARIFDLLWRKQGTKGLTRERIKDIIYMNDPNGGPECEQALRKVINRIRILVESVGIHVKRGYAGGEGYSLIFTNPQQAKILNVNQVKLKSHKGFKKLKIADLEPIWMTKLKEQV